MRISCGFLFLGLSLFVSSAALSNVGCAPASWRPQIVPGVTVDISYDLRGEDYPFLALDESRILILDPQYRQKKITYNIPDYDNSEPAGYRCHIFDVAKGGRKDFVVSRHDKTKFGESKSYIWTVCFDRNPVWKRNLDQIDPSEPDKWVDVPNCNKFWKRSIELRDKTDGHLKYRLTDPSSLHYIRNWQTVKISSDGQWLYCVDVARLSVWNLKTGKFVKCVSFRNSSAKEKNNIGESPPNSEAELRRLNCADFNPESHIFYQWSGSRITTWDAQSKKIIKAWHIGTAASVCHLVDGTAWAICENPASKTRSSNVFSFDTTTGKIVRSHRNKSYFLSQMSNGSVYSFYLAGSFLKRNRCYEVRDIRTDRLLRRLPVSVHLYWTSDLSPEGNWLYSTNEYGQLWRQRAR